MTEQQKLTKFEAWQVTAVIVTAFAGMAWGFWNISPWALLAVIVIASYPLWTYRRKVCGSCGHTNCPLNHNKQYSK